MEIPEGWKFEKLGGHIDLISGFAFKSAQYSEDESDIRLLRGANVSQGNLRWLDVKYWPKSQIESLERYHLRESDIVVSMDRTWIPAGLKIAVVKHSDLPSLLVQRVARLRAKTTLCQNLLATIMRGNGFVGHVKKSQTETAVPHISPKDIKDYKIAVPPLLEQRRIAKILGTWDQAIAVTEALIAKSEAQKKALMQQLLTGKRRLPGFEGDWKEVRLGDVVDIDWGNTSITKKQYVASGAQAYSAAGNDGFVLNAEHKKQGVVLSAIGARCGRCFLADGEWTAIKNTIVIFAQPNVSDNQFLFYLVNDARFWPISGGAQPFIGLKNAKRVKLMLPSFKEQKAIGEVFQTCSTQTVALQAKLQAQKAEKAALMQQLLTGKRRVKLTGVAA